jgi:hypothetical protein
LTIPENQNERPIIIGPGTSVLHCKQPNSVTRWLNGGFRLESDNPEFKNQLNQIDAAISRRD